jgi:multimeric flavodoxin WrbA
MSGLVQLMKESDVWILGTPVYWWGPTSQFKAFVDRWYGLDQRVFQGKRVVAAIPMGGGNEHYARHIVGMLEDICSYLRMDLIHTLIAPGMNGKSSVKENSRITELARQVGQEIMRPSAN